MANSNQGDQNANRTIIIPKGVLDPNQVNVINIPRKMNTSAPLLVTARKDGGFKSQTLPIWRDELSSPGKRRLPTNLNVTPKACSSRKGDDSTFSSVYDSSAEIEVNAKDFRQDVPIGQYNIRKPMTPSPERAWPKLQEHRGGRGFMPRHMSSLQEGVDPRLMNDSSLPSTMYSQDFLDPDMSGMQELSASSKSSGTDVDCLCPSDENVNATFDGPQNPNATFDRPQNPNATFQQPQNPNATFQQPQNPNATYNQAPRFNSTFIQPQNPNATYNRLQNPNATYGLPQDFDEIVDEEIDPNCFCPHGGDGASFNQRQNLNQTYGQYGDQFSEYQQPGLDEDPDCECPPDNTFGEQYQPYLGNETYSAQAGARGQQPSRYRTSPAAARNIPSVGPADMTYQTSGGAGGPYQVCSNVEEDPYAPRILHMSSRTFTQVNDNPPESLSITVDAPGGVDEHALRYATQMATFGDSGPRNDFTDMSYSSAPSQRSGGARQQQQGSYRTTPAAPSYRTTPAAPGNISCGGPPETMHQTSGSAGNPYQVCSNVEEDPYVPRILHMSSRTFNQVNDNPPESRSITVDAPAGVDEHALRYATQMATFGDSGPRTDESYFADQSYSSPSPPRGGRQVQPSQMGNTGYGFKEHPASPMYHPSGGFGPQYGFQGQGLSDLSGSGCDQPCYSTCSPNRTR